MLSYRHSFHAGNHADVLKHIVLMLILENLSLKEKGFYYLDTHSGVGRYRLSSNESEKTQRGDWKTLGKNRFTRRDCSLRGSH